MRKRKQHPIVDPRWVGKQVIPKTIHQVWIGSAPEPTRWLETWQRRNPNWHYTLWDNEGVFSRKWRNQKMIDHYLALTNSETFKLASGAVLTGDRAKHFQWHVIADIIRYEILFEEGGYMPGADTECLRSIDDKFGAEAIYTVNTGHLYANLYEDEFQAYRKRRYAPENASPILASVAGHPFLDHCIRELPNREWGEAVDTTGNVFMGEMIRKYGVPEDMRIEPYLKKGQRKNSHSHHHSGTTTGSYSRL